MEVEKKDIDMKKEEKNSIQIIVDNANEKTSGREIKKNLIDDTPQNNQINHNENNIKNQNNNENENKKTNNHPTEQNNLDINPKLDEIKKEKKNINNIPNEEKKCSFKICCVITLFIFFSLLLVLIELIFDCSQFLIFIYYKYNCKQCKAELYTKVNKIISNYLNIFIMLFITILVSIILGLSIKFIGYFIKILFSIVITGLGIIILVYSIINIVTVQKYYNKTTTWEDCGYFRGWMITWLISNYFGIAFFFLKSCFKNNREEE